MNSAHPFERLTPDFIMDAVESQGYRCDCRTLALNSYENRVYQVGIEDEAPLIAKFYRPERWSDEQICEEHQFCFELVEQELPVVAPLVNTQGESLFVFDGFRFALFPRMGGHAPELDNLDSLRVLGRLMGRIHLVGSCRPFAHRPRLDSYSYGHQSVAFLLDRFVPQDYRQSYQSLTTDLLAAVDDIVGSVGLLHVLRVHGDCHAGNMLWRNQSPHFVDFDDARTAPAIQDLWMFLSGDRARQQVQLAELVAGYEEFSSFRAEELPLIEVLRTLRMLHYSAWLARRWDDPAFRNAFPWFNTPAYWGEHILELREQFSLLQEPPLRLL
ncbi:MAG: serine/threonine protein kinase [Desulfuromonas sp.]|nr:MAG: serine/threonine protein kinase [Desulfuromonas sp.]